MYTLKVVEIKKETPDTITLSFKQPGLRKIKYLAGQYITLAFRINGRRYLRPYSFSSSPLVDSTLDVTIKRVHNGIVSNHIHDKVIVGDSIEVMEPMGEFTCEDVSVNHVFLWGVGSGITPLLSIAKTLLAKETKINVHLVYGNRDLERTIFYETIKSLKVLHKEFFDIHYFYTQLSVQPDLPYWIQGRISRDAVFKIMNTVICEDSKHFICGPIGLKESLFSVLNECGIHETQIFSEDFELIKDPKDFENISTQNIKLQFDNKEFELEIIKGQGILESALDAGLELPYSCQTGSCSTCKAQVLQGEVKMIGLNKEREDLNENETLLCCAYPISDNVVIKL